MIFSLRSNFGIESFFGLARVFKKLKEIPAYQLLLLSVGAVNKDIKRTENYADIHGHNILRLFDA